MEQLFISVLNNAITASVLIIAVIIVRAFGKKMPKWITCLLWMIVALKLVVPVHFESVLSLIPTREPIPANITIEQTPQIDSGISSVDATLNLVIEQNFAPDLTASVNPLQIWFHIGGLVWLTGMAVMLAYAVVTYLLIRKRVSASVKVAPKVYECDDISDSFIFGIIAPRVYLPSGLSVEAKEYILKHEFAHMSRFDHIWKPLGFAILSAYWFNPLCWVAYILLCRDIEYACDEKVTKNIEKDEKAEYCRVLLENSVPWRLISACPVTFGGIDVKNRIKNIANYRKPAFWITLISLVACIAVGMCFATSRASANEPKLVANTNPEISDLVRIYYESATNGDIGIINRIYKGLDSDQQDKIRKISEHIERYEKVETYTVPGPREGTYIAYVYSKVKFKEYKKSIPGIETLYICPDEDGKLYINGESADQEELEYIKEMSWHPDVTELNNKVAKEYNDMLDADEELESILSNIRKEVAQRYSFEMDIEAPDEQYYTTGIPVDILIRATDGTIVYRQEGVTSFPHHTSHVSGIKVPSGTMELTYETTTPPMYNEKGEKIGDGEPRTVCYDGVVAFTEE